jgi:hypothetical protein
LNKAAQIGLDLAKEPYQVQAGSWLERMLACKPRMLVTVARLERAVVKWTRSLNSHTGPRHVNGSSSRLDTIDNPRRNMELPRALLNFVKRALP